MAKFHQLLDHTSPTQHSHIYLQTALCFDVTAATFVDSQPIFVVSGRQTVTQIYKENTYLNHQICFDMLCKNQHNFSCVHCYIKTPFILEVPLSLSIFTPLSTF